MKSASVLIRALVFGGGVTVAVAVVGSIVGFVVAGPSGVVSALIGAALTAFFMGLTTLSILVADRVSRGRPSSTAYFSIVIGVWLLKFVVFVLVLVVLRGQPWVDPYVFFFSVVAAVVGSLIADIVALAGARVSHVSGLEAPRPDAPSAPSPEPRA